MNSNRSDTISLKHIFQIMLNKIWLIILLFIVCAGAAFGYAKFMMPLEYQSYTSMYVKNSTTIDGDSVNLNDLNVSKSLVSTYIAVLQDDTIMERLGDELISEYGEERMSTLFSINDGHISASALRGCLTMAAVNDTEVMKITAVTPDAEISAAMCNKLAEIAPDFLIRVVGAGSVEQIGAAKVDNTPVSPDILKYTILGAILGVVIAVAIIMLIDFLDNTVKDTKELVTHYDKAIIGEIYDFSDKKEKKKSNEEKHRVLTDEGTPFAVIESYKAMRTNIAFALAASNKKAFVVSSASPGEGKSTTSANIAIALAQTNKKVLLIDGDMRKPVQHKIFKLKNQKGLSGAISKMSKLEDCIRKNAAENLDVMPSGPKPPNPSELLASDQTAKILEQLSEQYDYIVIDTPPINVVSDAMGISKSVAGILLVLQYGKTTFEDVDEAMKNISLSDMNMLGFIMNDISTKKSAGSYYSQKYGSKYGYAGYGYGEEEKSSKEEQK